MHIFPFHLRVNTKNLYYSHATLFLCPSLSCSVCKWYTLHPPPPNKHSFFRPCGDKNIFQIYDKHIKIVSVAAQFLSWHTAKDKTDTWNKLLSKGGGGRKEAVVTTNYFLWCFSLAACWVCVASVPIADINTPKPARYTQTHAHSHSAASCPNSLTDPQQERTTSPAWAAAFTA